jgi:4-hydroxybenzoyl-CoA thioesterase
MGKVFRYPQKVLFKHCDPAGIVFFPRYFEMMNDCVETFFDEAVGVPFEVLLLSNGVPTAAIETRFRAPSRHGDMLELALTTRHTGRTSWRYSMTALCEGEVRFETEATLVHLDAEGKPAPWPDAMRARLQDYEAHDDT